MNAPANTAVMERPQQSVARVTTTPADLLNYAMQANADIDKLEKLMELQNRWEEREAKKAFVADMAEFKRADLAITKDHSVSFRTDKGVTAYDHATIGNVVGVIVPALAAHGFSHRWIIERAEGGLIRVRCVITHRLGHSEETVLEAGLDQTGGKNNIQAMISTKTYLERHSLLAATGLATRDQADDYDDESSKEREVAEAAKRNAEAKAKEEAAKPKVWAQDKFDEAMKKHAPTVASGSKTAAELLSWMEKKAPVNEAQRAAVMALTKTIEGTVIPAGEQA